MAGLNPLYPAPDKWRPGDNLLDNWYFVGGGSQLGWGHFPINQRGLTEYAIGYAIDRWQYYSPNGKTLKINQDSVTLPENCGLTYVFQDKSIFGKTVTCSVLAKGNIFATVTFTFAQEGQVLNSDNGFAFSKQPAESPTIYINRGPELADAELIAAKLELGGHQTLAHKEGGRWVLNRVPDFREEMAKCQAYQLKIPNSGSLFASVGIGTVISETTAQILIPTPVSTRTLPVATITGKWFLRGGGKIVTFNAGEAGVRVTATQYSENAITLEITGLTGLPVNYAMELMRDNDATAQILIDDNL